MEDTFKPRPRLKVAIDGIEHGATAFLSVRDIEFIAEIDFEEESIDYRGITLSVLRTHLIDYHDQVIKNDAIDDSELERFIDFYINSSEELKSIYIDNRDNDPFKRFIESLRKRTEVLSKQIIENIRPALQGYAKTLEIIMPSMSQFAMAPKLQESINTIAEMTRAYQTSMANITRVFAESVNWMLPDYSQITNSLSQIIARFAEVFKSPSLSEDRKKILQDAFSQWGKYGWTLPPNADLELFFEIPIDEKTASKIVRPYITNGEMHGLFSVLLEMKHIRKSDLKEAIANYEDKRYKSCIMMLFSLIDARIIRLQERQEGKQRPSGCIGATKYFEKVDADKLVEMTFADALYKCSILSSLGVVFEKGNDFRVQPDVINRNFVDHGMLHRMVTQRDCKKVFLLLYNFVALVEDLEHYDE